MITIVHQQPLHAIQPVSLTFTHPLRESSTQRSRRSENSAPSWYIVSRRPSHWCNIQKMKTSIINGSEVSRLSVAIQFSLSLILVAHIAIVCKMTAVIITITSRGTYETVQ